VSGSDGQEPTRLPDRLPNDRSRTGRVRASFVLPVFNEAETIREFWNRLRDTLSTATDVDPTFIFVDDGSRDDSWRHLCEIQDKDPRVVAIRLSRNFGHQFAVTAGLDAARGDVIIIMDTDLQDPPAVTLEMIASWRDGADVAYGQRASRKDSLPKRVTASAFYRTLDALTDVAIPRDTGDFRLMDRAVVDALGMYQERNRFLRGLVATLGFHQEAVVFERDARYAGETGYTYRKMVKLAGDGLLGFSTVPLRWISRIGVMCMLGAALGILYALVLRVFFPQISVPGWTLLIVAVLFLGGIQSLSIGVIGSYVGRIYTEVQARPLYLLRERRGPQ
jgi:glycosyltransferase involved in cell wall biosynthesis